MGAPVNNRESSFLEALLTIPAIRGQKISRDSKFIAYTWENVHPNLDVFLVSTEESARPFALTKTPEATFIVDFVPEATVIMGIPISAKGKNIYFDRPRL